MTQEGKKSTTNALPRHQTDGRAHEAIGHPSWIIGYSSFAILAFLDRGTRRRQPWRSARGLRISITVDLDERGDRLRMRRASNRPRVRDDHPAHEPDVRDAAGHHPDVEKGLRAEDAWPQHRPVRHR